MQELLEKHARNVLGFLVHESTLLLTVLDRDLSVLETNPAFQKLLETPEDAGTLVFSDLLTADSREEFLRSMENGPLPLKTIVELQSAGEVTARLDIAVLPLAEGYLLFGEHHDLSESEALRQMTLLNNELANTARELHRKNMALEKAQSEIKTLKGLLPICSFCKKIRDDQGYWKSLETYITARTDADFSHGICDECMHKHYPQYAKPKS